MLRVPKAGIKVSLNRVHRNKTKDIPQGCVMELRAGPYDLGTSGWELGLICFSHSSAGTLLLALFTAMVGHSSLSPRTGPGDSLMPKSLQQLEEIP